MSRPHPLPAVPPGAGPRTPRTRGRREIALLRRATHWLDIAAARLLPYDAGNPAAPDQRARPTIFIGLVLMFLLFGVFGLWATLVPLASGAIAPGRVASESSRKEIQHLEGGIVKEILVRDGDSVTLGQPLIRLDSTNAKARRDQVLGDYLAAKASEARLIAERDGKDAISFPTEYLTQESSNPKVKEALETQRRLFATRRAAMEGQISVLNQRAAQSGDEIRGLRDQVSAASTQINLLAQEIAVVQGLLASGNATKPRLLALQRQQADLVGQRGQAQALISRANQTISESKTTILNLKNDALNRIIAELKDTQVQLSSLEEQARSTSDVARRVEITAPLAGTITGLSIHTIGGVVRPGETLMYLVPSDDRLIVEARVAIEDVDVVQAGLIAQVRLTAFKSRYLRPIKGKVLTIAADRFDDKNTGESYYIARIEIPQQEIAALGRGITLTSGMPADVLIVTGNRTMLSYIMQPIRASFGRAFHDQ
ncbi:MAG: HlyD family type I secretion periplasmic adaptor subunit [Alphaproteobacteria bacterium]|nr:HlyD family type I secretion periplasmic adaptor subunit [Alphaproteobacteria bacterium]